MAENFRPAPSPAKPESPKTPTPEPGSPPAGLSGQHGFDGSPEVADDRPVLERAQVKAPNLTAAFVKAYGLDDDVLEGIARGEIPPPPTIGPEHTSDLYLTPGGWQQTAPGVAPGDGTAISR